MIPIYLEKIKRRLLSFITHFFYQPIFLNSIYRIYLGSSRSRSEGVSKLGKVSDLIRPEFINLYRNILTWQKNEKQSVRVSRECCRKDCYEDVVRAYENRTNHKRPPGRTRKLKFEMVWETTWSILNADIKPGLIVADAGTENSCLPYYLASRGCTAYGLDLFLGRYGKYFRENILEKCVDKTLKLDIFRDNKKQGEVIYKTEDVTRMNIEDNFFDRVFCLATLRHLIDDTRAIQEMARILKPQGMLIFGIPLSHHYSEAPVIQKAEIDVLNPVNPNRMYTREEAFARLIKPSGLSLVGGSFETSSMSDWKKHHFFGQEDNVLSAIIFLKK